MRKLLMPVSILVLTAVAAINVGCGTTSAVPPPPPSGIIIVAPATSATAPFPLGNPDGNPLPSQTFTASELGYTGSFTFVDTATGVGLSETVTVPTTATSATLSPMCRAYLHGHCILGKLLQTVVVHDSLGNTTKIYAQ